MAKTTAQSAISSWSRITNMLRITSREAYTRDLDLTQRMQYIHKLTHGTSTTGPQRKYPTNRVSSCLVHLAGEHLSSTSLHAAEEEDEGGLGPNRGGREVQSTPVIPDVDAKPT